MSKNRIIQWMHPSWRDLVIERLSRDPTIRSDFLAKCGMNGFMLALSAAGGTKGDLQTPLLTSVEDWESLAETGQRLIANESAHNVWRVTATVSEAVRNAIRGQNSFPHIVTGPAAVFARKVLGACVERWNADPGSALTRTVRQYFVISEHLSPLPPSPDFRPIWELSHDASVEEIESFDPEEVELFLSEIDDWLALGAVILENEPRLLRQIGFPSEFTAVFREFVPSLAERASLCEELSSEDECQEEDDRLDFLSSLVDTIGGLIPDIDEEVAEADTAIDSAKVYVAQELERIRAEKRADEWDEHEEWARRKESTEYHPGAMSPTARSAERDEASSPLRTMLYGSPMNSPVDIEKLFTDL
jgi:hypothetical protein